MFMDFLRSLSIFGAKASPERIQELLEVVEGQADLDAQFNVRELLETCLFMTRIALNYI